MKISNTRHITEKIMQSMQIKEISSTVNMIITNSIDSYFSIPPEPDKLRKEAELIQKEVPEYSVDRIMMLLMVESMIEPYLEQQPEEMGVLMNCIAAESKVFDVEKFNKNPYIQNIDFTNQENGDFELCYDVMMPYELYIYDIPKRIKELYVDIQRVGCFTEEFKYPLIVQKSIKSTWMSISPNEIFTMSSPIKNAKGKVLTLGCGIGYFAYMASLKEDVESVTIIELEQNVIELFENYLLPQFENKEKITIIKADAIEYLRNMEDGEFDYCFADIWIGIYDIEQYLAVKQIGRHLRKTKMEYWIEESFAIFLSNYVWIEILFAFSNNIGISLIDEHIITGLDKRTMKYVQELLQDVEITKPEHIDYYMDPKNILNLVNITQIIF